MKINSVVSLEEIEPGIGLLVMEDRQHKNTFSQELIDGLINAFAIIANQQQLKAIVFTGFGNYFAAGGTQEGLFSLQAGEGKFTDQNLYSLALDCPIPVISAMQGHGIGGGFVMGLFADFVLLSRESIYCTNFMRYGFTPGMGATYIVPKKLGMSLGHEMLFNGGNFRGAELAKRGVPFDVLPRDQVVPRALELARELAEKPRLSLVTLKNHLCRQLRAELPAVIEEEVVMHETTFHQPEVKTRIKELFGQ